MRSRCLLFTALLSFSSFMFSFDKQMADCHVQITMADGTPIGSNLRLRLFDKETRLLETGVPLSGRVSLPPLPFGNYRVQVGGGLTNFVTSGSLRAGGSEPCVMGISIEGHSDAAHRIVDDDLDVEDLKVTAKARALFHSAFADFQRGDLEKARDGFLQVTKLDPRLSRAYNVLGVISGQLGDRYAARQYFEEALELNPRSKTALMNLAKLSMLEQRYSDALLLLERLRSGTRETADIHAMESIAFLRLKRFNEAVREAQAAHALPHTNWANVHVVAAAAHEALHENEAAIQEYQQYIQESTVEPLRTIVVGRIQSLSGIGPQNPSAPPISSLLPQ